MNISEWRKLAEIKRDEIKDAAELALRTSYENRHFCSVVMYADGDIHVYEEISPETHPGNNIVLVRYYNPFGDIKDILKSDGSIDMSSDFEYILRDIC